MTMEYLFETGTPITEEEALARVHELGFHGLAYDEEIHEDEPLHWHEFDSVVFVISGTGSFADKEGNVTETLPGVSPRGPGRLAAPKSGRHCQPHRPGDQPARRPVDGTDQQGPWGTACFIRQLTGSAGSGGGMVLSSAS